MNNTFNGNVVDVEASGLGSYSYPIEVGVVLSDGTTYEALIKPPADWQHWDPQAEQLHGISRDTLHRLGRPLHEVCMELNELCADKTLYSDCWVYDSPWLNKMFAKAGITPKFKCSPIEGILQEEYLENWVERKNAYIRSTQIVPHRALNDAIIISETLERVLIEPIPMSHRYYAPMPMAAYGRLWLNPALAQWLTTLTPLTQAGSLRPRQGSIDHALQCIGFNKGPLHF